MDQITESDVLAGLKRVELPTRDGITVHLTVRGLPWRDALRFSTETDLFRHSEAALNGGVSTEEKPLLDSLTPDALGYLVAVISALTNGLPKLKKSQEIMNLHWSANCPARVAPLDTPTSGTPNVPLSSADIPLEISDHLPQQNLPSPSNVPKSAKPTATSDSSP